MTDLPENPLWDFSLTVYGRAGTDTACLALQERYGLDVNLLLFCCWAGSRGYRLDRGEIIRLIDAAKPWQECVVRPLRDVRVWLKARRIPDGPGGPAAQLRGKIKARELEAEAIEQQVLAETLPIEEGAGGAALIAANFNAYLDILAIEANTADLADLATVLRGCYPKLAPLEAVWVLSG